MELRSEAPPGVSLMEGEEIVHHQQPRWRDYPKSLMVGIPLCFVLVGFYILFKVWLQMRREHLVVTTDRVIEVTSSLTSTSTNEYPIRDIAELEVSGERRSFIGSKRGTVTFSHGGGGQKVSLENIRNYDAIATTIREQQRDLA